MTGTLVDMAVSGEYVVVDPPRRLVFTWRWDGAEAVTMVTMELAETAAGAATELTVVHQRFTDPADRDSHVQGWHDCLDRLPGHLAAN